MDSAWQDGVMLALGTGMIAWIMTLGAGLGLAVFLEFVIKQSSLQKIQHWNEHFAHHLDLQDFQED